MANSDKNIVITPSTGSSSVDPKIVFSGADASTAAQNISVYAYPTNGGTLSFEGSVGQLFSVTNTMTGTLFSVNDISGMPSIEVLDTGTIKLSQYGGNILVGTATDIGGGQDLQIGGSSPTLAINANASTEGMFAYYYANTLRASLALNSTGDYTYFRCYNSSGTYIDNAITVANGAGGQITFARNLGLNASLGITINSGAPGVTTSTLYQVGNVLYFNGSVVGGLSRSPSVQAVASVASATPNANTDDMLVVTAMNQGFILNNPSGSPGQGQKLVVRLKDNGVARTIGYGTYYRALGNTLPTTTITSKTLYLGFMYNSTDTKWDLVALSIEA